jgi:hypothetical protein
MDVHPETIRVWEKSGIIKPQRRSGRRFFSENDLKRLRFIKKLISEDLNLPAIRHQLKYYPCWNTSGCPSCMHSSELAVCAKPCWQEEGLYCKIDGSEDACLDCEYRKESHPGDNS